VKDMEQAVDNIIEGYAYLA
jgi:chromosome segregation ATPase